MSLLPAARLPNITTLRRKLNYGDKKLKRCDILWDDLNVFRKRFQTKTFLAGPDLVTWSSAVHQEGLTEMACEFLERQGTGSEFWPDDRSSVRYNTLQYSKDHKCIQNLLTQLLFRLNEQETRNRKYKKKNKREKELESKQTTEQSIDGIATEEQQSLPAQTLSVQVKPRIVFICRLILSRYPTLTTRGRTLSGNLDGVTLREIIQGLPQIEHGACSLWMRLMLAITGPGLNLIEEIQMNDGNGFDSLRKVIKRAIRDHLTARSSGKEAAVTAMESLVYEVELEPVQEPVLEDEKQRAGNSSHESGRWRGSDGNQDDDFII